MTESLFDRWIPPQLVALVLFQAALVLVPLPAASGASMERCNTASAFGLDAAKGDGAVRVEPACLARCLRDDRTVGPAPFPDSPQSAVCPTTAGEEDVVSVRARSFSAARALRCGSDTPLAVLFCSLQE